MLLAEAERHLRLQSGEDRGQGGRGGRGGGGYRGQEADLRQEEKKTKEGLKSSYFKIEIYQLTHILR